MYTCCLLHAFLSAFFSQCIRKCTRTTLKKNIIRMLIHVSLWYSSAYAITFLWIIDTFCIYRYMFWIIGTETAAVVDCFLSAFVWSLESEHQYFLKIFFVFIIVLKNGWRILFQVICKLYIHRNVWYSIKLDISWHDFNNLRI